MRTLNGTEPRRASGEPTNSPPPGMRMEEYSVGSQSATFNRLDNNSIHFQF